MFYLDDAATTRMADEAINAMMNTCIGYWGNSNSTYLFGTYAQEIVDEAKRAIKTYIGNEDVEIYFTSGASEANHIMNHVLEDLEYEIVRSSIEHSSNNGLLHKGVHAHTIVPYYDTHMFFITNKENYTKHICYNHMLVNNETGECFKNILNQNAHFYDALIYMDCTQGFFDKELIQGIVDKVNIITMSFHKVHGAKGLGVIILNDSRLPNSMSKTLRMALERETKRTQNTPALATVAPALHYSDVEYIPWTLETLLCGLKNADSERFRRHKMHILQDEFEVGQHEYIGTIRNIRFEGVNAEAFVRILSNFGVYCSSGSACLNGKESYVLKAMGVENSHEYIRLSSHVLIDEATTNALVTIFDQALEVYETLHGEGVKANE